jgi:hypothetical protein
LAATASTVFFRNDDCIKESQCIRIAQVKRLRDATDLVVMTLVTTLRCSRKQVIIFVDESAPSIAY